MGCTSQRHTFCDRLLNAENAEYMLTDHISENTGHDDDRNRDRDDTAKFLRNTHSDRRRDRLRKQGHILLMAESKDSRKRQNRNQACEHAGDQARHDRLYIVFQKLQLLIQRHRQTHSRRCQQIA